MRIITPEAFHTQRWKNGGGVTHEIARAEADCALLWRLSVAEVTADGPFSAFPGLERILTVIEGAGLILDTPGGPIAAHPLDPVQFSGELPVAGRLMGGPIRDLNVIFDPTRIAADVRIADDAAPPVLSGPGALYCLSGRYHLDEEGIAPGSVALFDLDPPRSEAGATALLVSLAPVR